MIYESRPDPDALLARVEREENQRRRGRLKVFFGAAAGVGKTYAMLLAAKAKRDEGIDVVVGLVETHDRQETVAVLQGLDVLPPKLVKHRGTVLREFDLDGTLNAVQPWSWLTSWRTAMPPVAVIPNAGRMWKNC
jgi:Osmosensitive K+ channel histidine kinase